MPLDQQIATGDEQLALLNKQFANLSTETLIARLHSHPQLGKVALASSFGAEAAVLLHLVAQIIPDLPVLFIDTELLFRETLEYQVQLSKKLGLTNVITVMADREALFLRDPDNLLNHFEPDTCCALRKTEPLERALSQFDSWITGRKRFHGGQREGLQLLELDHQGRIKINPLNNWTSEDVIAYRKKHSLPAHPLIERGYASIGCRPCTRPLRAGESGRDGRWGDSDKTECGIHLPVKGAA